MRARAARRAAALLAPLLLAGCALARPQLPAPAAGFSRHVLAEVDATCRDRGCAHYVRVGGVEHEVASDVRLMTPQEALEEPPPGRGREVLGAAGRELMRGLGFETTELMVGAGIRGVGDPEGLLNLVCDVVWLDERTTSRVEGEDEVARARVGEGYACTAGAPDDTLPAWHFRSGIPPEREGLRRALDSLGTIPPREPTDVAPMTLTRTTGTDAAPVAYPIALASRTALMPRYTWVVRRPDGTVVGAFVRSGLQGMHAVDVAPDADAQEATVLRLIGAMLAVPLRE